MRSNAGHTAAADGVFCVSSGTPRESQAWQTAPERECVQTAAFSDSLPALCHQRDRRASVEAERCLPPREQTNGLNSSLRFF